MATGRSDVIRRAIPVAGFFIVSALNACGIGFGVVRAPPRGCGTRFGYVALVTDLRNEALQSVIGLAKRNLPVVE